MTTLPISIIGFGNMAQAIASGLIKKGYQSLSVASPSLHQGITQEGIATYSSNIQAIEQAKIIILAVKPAQMKQVLGEIIPFLKADTLLISVAAGLSLTWFAKQFNAPWPIVRTMPNTPVSVGLGAIPMIANAWISEVQKQVTQDIFSSLGVAVWIEDESQMDVFTALSGSGPAYVYYFIESMIDAACSLGLSESIAKLMTLQTLEGALFLAKHSALSLNQLRTKVTSPKGTTAAALDLLQPELHKLMHKAIEAAKERANEMGSVLCQL